MMTEHQWIIPVETILHYFNTRPCRKIRPHIGTSLLTILQVLHTHVALKVTSINDLWITWIRRKMCALTNGQGSPIFFCYAITIGAMRDAHAGIILLCTKNVIGKRVVSRYSIKLGRRLIVICSPVFSSII